jgi:hypothetical protein
MRILIAALLITTSLPAFAADKNSINADLTSLENRFFMHAYSSDTVDERLDRLDKLVYGRVRQGTDQDRISSLLLSVPNVQSQSVATSTSSSQPGSTTLEPEHPQTAMPGPAPSRASSSGQTVDYYPTVTALEKKIEGTTNISLPVQDRLAKLETVAFGKPSTSDDLSKRVDHLKEYARKKFGSDDYLTSTNAVGFNSGDAGLTAEVTSMEQEVFGTTYGRDDLNSRLARLEHAVLPQRDIQTFTPMPARVQQLEQALNTSRRPINTAAAPNSFQSPSYYPSQTFGSNSYSQMQPALQTAQNQPKKRSIFHKLGVVLGDVGGMAARSMMYGGY